MWRFLAKTSLQEKLLISKPISLSDQTNLRQNVCEIDHREAGDLMKSAKSWTPKTLRPLTMFSIIMLSICLALALQLLLQKSNQDGGILCVQNLADISTGQSFAYLYLPVVIAVAFSLSWEWIDIDIKRMEPYFQLSKPGGVSAEHSLLLEYPYDFIAAVPFKALRLKHWTVFSGSVVVMIVFWVITPLIGSIFNLATVNISSTIDIWTNASLLTPLQQIQKLNGEFFNLAYGIIWLNLAPPPFTTRNAALLPFMTDAIANNADDTTTITASTTLFSVELECSSAIVTHVEPDKQIFSNGKGCSVQNSYIRYPKEYTMSYVGWFPAAYAPSLWANGCSVEFSRTFFAFWGRPASQNQSLLESRSNYTGIFCEPIYYQQDVAASLYARNLSVITTSPQGPRTILDDSTFNATDFAYLLNTAMSSLNDYQPGEFSYPGTSEADIAGRGIITQFRLSNISVVTPTLDITGYAFGQNSTPPALLYEASLLADAFQRAYQVLFSTAISTITITRSGQNSTRTGISSRQLSCIVLDRTFTPLAQAFLISTAAIGLIILVLTWKRRNELNSDSASLMDVMKLIPSRSATLHYCHNSDLSSGLRDKRNPTGQKFKLTNSIRPVIEAVRQTGREMTVSAKKTHENGKFNAIMPIEMSVGVGFIWAIIHLVAISTLIFLRCRIQRNNGLPLPSESQFIQHFVLNYVPTALSTFLEPFWVLINRTLCLLQPFQALRLGHAKKSASIDAQYTAAPPQLALWRAVKNRHFLLSLVCSVSILANVLAVSLSGLFRTLPVTIEAPNTLFKYNLHPPINETFGYEYGDFDVIYTLLEALAGRSSPPPWTDRNFAYLPFSIDSSSNVEAGAIYVARTRSFGLKVQCNDQSSAWEQVSMLEGRINAPYIPSNGTSSTQNLEITLTEWGALSQSGSPGPLTSANLAAEIFRMDYESNQLYQGWLRYTPFEETTPGDKTESKFSHTLIGCMLTMVSMESVIRVDSEGNVFGATPVPGTEESMGRFFKYSGMQQNLLENVLETFATTGGAVDVWHNDSIALNWVDYIIKEIWSPVEAANVNPNDPAPSYEDVGPLVENIYAALFAVYFGYNLFPYMEQSFNEIIEGTVLRNEERVFFAPYMFEISLSILILDLVVASLVYIKQPKRFLPHLPTNIASIATYFAHSHLLAEVTGNISSHQRNDGEEILYGFGEFTGTDGKAHVGIEKHPYVRPLGHGEASLLERLSVRTKGNKITMSIA